MITNQPDPRRAQAHLANISNLYQQHDLAVAQVLGIEAAIDRYWDREKDQLNG